MEMSWKGQWLEQAGVDPTRDDVGAIGYTFAHACKTLTELKMSSNLDEETMTGALLGAFAASFKPAVSVFGADTNQKCSWARYRKGGKRSDSESIRGADFALIVTAGDELSRIAIFQAKKVKVTSEGVSIDVHHYPGRDPNRTSQLISLFNTGKKILKSSGCLKPEISCFGWIHYLAYSDDGITHTPLKNLESEIEAYSAPKFNQPLHVDVKEFRSFSDLLLAGCNNDLRHHDGWLTLSNDVLVKELPDLIDIMEVCVGDEGSGGLILRDVEGLELISLEAHRSIPEPLLQPPSGLRRGPQ